jgi:hypothetical protein
MDDDCEAFGRISGRGNRSTLEKPASMPFYPSQIPQGLIKGSNPGRRGEKPTIYSSFCSLVSFDLSNYSGTLADHPRHADMLWHTGRQSLTHSLHDVKSHKTTFLLFNCVGASNKMEMEGLRFSRRWLWRIAFCEMLRRVAVVRTDVSEELSASIIRVSRIGELGRYP